MADERVGNDPSHRSVRLAGRPAHDPDFTGVGEPRARYSGGQTFFDNRQSQGTYDARGRLQTTDRPAMDPEPESRTRLRQPSQIRSSAPRMPRAPRTGADAQAALSAGKTQAKRRVPRANTKARTARPSHPKPKRMSRWHLAALSAALVLVFLFLGSCAFHGTAGIDPDAEFKLIDAPVEPGIAFAFSTPRNQWRAGEVPHIYQTDPVWAEKSYAGGTIRKNACGPTCLTMVYVYKTGKTDMTPVEMCALAEAGNYCPTGATEWSFMLYGAASLGLNATQLYRTRDALESSLKAGDAVIASVRPGTFTNVGHYIVLHGIDDTGQVTVYDPNSQARSLRKWGIVEVLDEVNAMWAY